jgi:hypothetical protein
MCIDYLAYFLGGENPGVTLLGILANIRRMRFRAHLSIRKISRKTGLARNTVRD